MIGFSGWQIDFTNPVYIALSVLLLASLLLSLGQVARRLFQRAPLRALAVMLLNLVAYCVVLLLLLEPRYLRTVDKSIVLITEGADISDTHRAAGENYFVAPGAVTSALSSQNPVDANWLLDVGQLELREPALSTIEVAGYGLEQDQWPDIPGNVRIEFKPPGISGFTGMRWQRVLAEGETLQVSGYYRSSATGNIIDLQLLDPAANIVDETRLKGGQPFKLATSVKASGHLEYRLQARVADTLQSEQLVPVEVGTLTRLNIMIEQSAPSFETRALKNYAAASGHALRINTVISKDKTISQSTNLPTETDTAFSPPTLAVQDVLIMDGRALVNLPASRRQWLTEAVDNGLGLLVLADSALLEHIGELNTNLLSGFQLSPSNEMENTAIPRLLTGAAGHWQEPLTVATMQLDSADADVLVDDGHDRNLVVRRTRGLGYIAISLISHSHDWLTAGHRADWSEYWAALLSALARQREESFLLPQSETDFFRVNRRTAVCAFSSEVNTNVVITAPASRQGSNPIELQLVKDALDSPRQCGFFWPDSGGWHRLQLFSADHETILDEQAIYIFREDQWLAQQRDQRVKATRARALSDRHPLAGPTENRVSEPLGLFWLWLTLILSATLLWLERRLDFG